MLSASKKKIISSLSHKKFRHLHQSYIIEGTKLLDEAIQAQADITDIFATSKWLSANHKLEIPYAIEPITEAELKKISQMSSPPGVLALVKISEQIFSYEQMKGQLTIALDGINNPGNLGSIIRSADWFGVEHIFCSKDTTDIYNPKVVQAAMGSVFRIKIIETELDQLCQNALKHGIRICGAVMDGKYLHQSDLSDQNKLLIIGSESHGIRDYLQPFLQEKITIPCFPINRYKKTAESLNAAIATSILLSAFRLKNL